MSESIFRQKSIDRVSSPEALNDYVKVANPGVWILLSSIIILLLGICAWGVLGHLDSRLTVCVVSMDNQTTCYIPEEQLEKVSPGLLVVINGTEGSVISISQKPVRLDQIDTYVAHKAGLEADQWVYEVTCSNELSDGIYDATIVTESVSPMSFIVN